MRKVIKRVVAIALSFVVSVTMLPTLENNATVKAASDDTAKTLEQDINLSPSEAKAFLGFIFSTSQLSDEQLNKNDAYKLLTGQLSGKQKEYASVQFLELLNARMEVMVGESEGLVNYSSDFLIDYLSAKINQKDEILSIQDNILHDIGNQFFDWLQSEYLISGNGLQNMEYEFFQNGILAWNVIDGIADLPGKVQEWKKQLLALCNGVFYSVGSNRLEMYKYFLQYKNNLNIKYNIGEEAFNLVQDTNELLNEKLIIIKNIEPTLANWPFLDNNMLLWSTDERIAIIQKWAEYTYLLENNLLKNAVSVDNELDTEGKVDNIHYNIVDESYLQYKVIDGKAYITKYTGNYSVAMLPSTINGYTISGISNNAFEKNKIIKYLYIPASINYIGDNCFLNCINLKKVIITNSNTAIGQKAFNIYRTEIIYGKKYELDAPLDLTICSSGESSVETYANANGLNFENLDWDGKSSVEVYPINGIYYIGTPAELRWVCNQSNNFSSETTIVIMGTLNFKSYNWTPIGNETNAFTAKIEMKDCLIKNFKSVISSGGFYSDVYVGIFGNVESDNIYIDNVKIENTNVYGSGYQTIDVGTLFGKVNLRDNGNINIKNSSFSGTVNGSEDKAGGIIGELNLGSNAVAKISDVSINENIGGSGGYDGRISGGVIASVKGSGKLIIDNSLINGSIKAITTYGYSNGKVGGLIGMTSGALNIKITKCAVYGTIDGQGYANSSFFGGFIGQASENILQIDNSFLAASLSGYWKGGFLGNSSCSNYNDSYIKNCYISGIESCSAAAFISFNDSGDNVFLIENCYYDTEKTAAREGKKVCAAGFLYESWVTKNVTSSFGYSTEEMADKNNYKNWDFENVWYMDDDGYPKLKGLKEKTDFYMINTWVSKGGKINSSGYDQINTSDSKTYEITEDEEYCLDRLVVDGNEVEKNMYYTFSNVNQSHTIKVYFKSRKIRYITYYTDGGTLTDTKVNQYYVGQSRELPKATKNGKIFLGWYDNDRFEGEKIERITVDDTENKILYAKWGDYVGGKCGDNAFWKYDATTQQLIISGSGRVYDYEFNKAPWLLDDRFNWDNISELIINEGIEYIGNNAFLRTNGDELVIPNSVVEIGEMAFAYGKMKKIKFGENLEKIGKCAFSCMFDLEEVTMPNSIKEVGDLAFGCDHSLKKISFPQNIEKIGEGAIDYCENLENIVVKSDNCIWGKNINISIENAIFYGPNNSTTEQMAQENGFRFIPISQFDNESESVTNTEESPSVDVSERIDQEVSTDETSKKTDQETSTVEVSEKIDQEVSTDETSIKIEQEASTVEATKKENLQENMTSTEKFEDNKTSSQEMTKSIMPTTENKTIIEESIEYKNLKKVNTTKITSVKKAKKSIKVSWKKVKGVSGYQLQYSTSKKFKKAKKITIRRAENTNKLIKKIQNKKKYYIRIRTYLIFDGRKYYSDWSKSRSQRIK
ncbi:leucine-rich repeat protein [Eubacterium sp.]